MYESMIIPATRDCDVEEVRKILDRGDDPNERDVWKFTALMYAASDNEKEIARLLLDHGADPFLKDARGKTAYDMAKEKVSINSFRVGYLAHNVRSE